MSFYAVALQFLFTGTKSPKPLMQSDLHEDSEHLWDELERWWSPRPLDLTSLPDLNNDHVGKFAQIYTAH